MIKKQKIVYRTEKKKQKGTYRRLTQVQTNRKKERKGLGWIIDEKLLLSIRRLVIDNPTCVHAYAYE